MALTEEGHIAEFIKLNGFFWNGTCGQCALEVAKAAAKGIKASQLDMIALAHEMQQHGQAGPNGASTLWALGQEARRQGLDVLIEWDYQEPLQKDWHTVLLENAGINPIVLQHARGRNLHDVETGAADEAGLNYHFTVILGKQPDGYVDNDGDNPQVTYRFQVYNYATLENSVVCGLLMVKGPSVPTPVHVPAGWTDANQVLTAPNGLHIEHAFRDFILYFTGGWNAANEPSSGEYSDGRNGTFQDFKLDRLHWNGQIVSVENLPPPPPPPAPPSTPLTDLLKQIETLLAQALVLAKGE